MTKKSDEEKDNESPESLKHIDEEGARDSDSFPSKEDNKKSDEIILAVSDNNEIVKEKIQSNGFWGRVFDDKFLIWIILIFDLILGAILYSLEDVLSWIAIVSTLAVFTISLVVIKVLTTLKKIRNGFWLIPTLLFLLISTYLGIYSGMLMAPLETTNKGFLPAYVDTPTPICTQEPCPIHTP